MTEAVKYVVCYPNPPHEKGVDCYLAVEDIGVFGTCSLQRALLFDRDDQAAYGAEVYPIMEGRPPIVKRVIVPEKPLIRLEPL